MDRTSIKHVHILKEAYDKMMNEAITNIPHETGGFIVGYVTLWNGEYHVIVVDVILVKHKSTEVSVEFLTEGAVEVAKLINEYLSKGYYVVGWFHSHPGYHAVPSKVDLKSHNTYFRDFYQIGIIIDPINSEVGVFTCINNRPILVPATIWITKSDKILEKFSASNVDNTGDNHIVRIVRNTRPPTTPWFKVYIESDPNKLKRYLEKFEHRTYMLVRSKILYLRKTIIQIIYIVAITAAIIGVILLLLLSL